MIRSLLRFSIILAFTVPACNAREEAPGQSQAGETQAAPGSAAGDPSVVHHPEPPQRPKSKRDSIQLEGTWQPITATLVKPQSSVPFSTYIPDDVAFDAISTDEGEGYYFFANFGEQRNENVFMLVFVLPPGQTATDARRLGEAMIDRRKGRNLITRVEYGAAGDRQFYIAIVWPGDYGDGMGSRTAYITRQWVWLNDGRGLEATLQPRRE